MIEGDVHNIRVGKYMYATSHFLLCYTMTKSGMAKIYHLWLKVVNIYTSFITNLSACECLILLKIFGLLCFP